MFRMILWILFRNFYSANRWSEMDTRETLFAYAIAETRKHHPHFWPETA